MNDINGYIERMNKSLGYKKFWFDKVDPSKFDIIIDFGCGNGDLGLAALMYFQDKEVIFYETDSEMRKQLVKNLELYGQDYVDRITVVSNPELLKGLIKNERTRIIFSSVLHECYSFGTLPFDWIELKCRYVCIRDMDYDYCPFTFKDKLKIFIHSRKKDFFDFVRRYGFEDKDVLHFLLKHLYKENWNTEVKENYFATPWATIASDLIFTYYRLSYQNRYNIPFLVNYSKEQFGVEYNYHTHREMIFERCKW